ncbi:hypothetical protein [Nocardia jinanensis]|uniref:hypothetical protein n=1 Tax=Nocardia jinanensis TaxID=382504 RepID=UPI001663B47C|nr:hypothetical protein [Nocardia jinanensis]
MPHPDEPEPPPTSAGPPPAPPEPALPPGRHPVVVHDCDYSGGYEVTEKRNHIPGATIDVHAIEVYEARGSGVVGPYSEEAADVFVHNTARPQVLVLTAEGGPTVWRVHADDGVRIPMVVLGSGDSRVEGVPHGIEVVTERNWASVTDPALAALAERSATSETDCYSASVFSVRPELNG